MMDSKETSGRTQALQLLMHSVMTLGIRYVGFVFSTLVFASLSLLPAQLLRYFAENAYSPSLSDPSNFIFKLSVLGAAIAILLWFSRTGAVLCQEWLRVSLESGLRARILEQLHRTPLASLEVSRRGDWYSSVTNDLARIEFFMTDSIPSQIRMATILLGTATLFTMHGGLIALIPISAAMIIALANFVIHGRLAGRLREVRDLHSSVFQTLIENFEGIRTIRSHGAETFIRDSFRKVLTTLSQKSLCVVRVIGVAIGSNEFLSQSLITLCLIAVTFSLNRGRIGIAEALLYPFYIGMFFNAAQDLAKSAYDWNRFFIEGGRLATFLSGIHEAGASRSLPLTAAEFPTEIQVLEFSVGYAGCPPLTAHVSLSLRRGELCLLSGPSGCGKSTLLETLAGLRPALKGKIRLTAHNGKIVSELSAESQYVELRRYFAYVEQRPYLFEGTLRENLVFNHEVSEAKVIWEVLEKVSLKDFALQAGGLDHKLSDRGENVSEGERYRLALARALLLKRPFLLLDEPFAALDARTISIVTQALQGIEHFTGIFMVTHQVPETLDIDGIYDFENLAKSNGRTPVGNPRRVEILPQLAEPVRV